MKYEKVNPSGCKDIGIRSFDFVTKTQLLCKISNIYCKIKLLSKKCAKTKCAWNIMNYTFLKSPWPSHFKYAKSCSKTKNVQISFDRLFAKNLQFFFAKLVQSVSLCHRLSKKLNFIKIWQVKVVQNKDLVCYRKKQSFRTQAVSIKARF